MYRIRFHGRGGQGMKTASRIVGSALFMAGFEVQDAPRYGAERRGAPIFAYVRADHEPIFERGLIGRPDLVVVADDSLPAVPAAGVLPGLDGHSVLFIISTASAETWRARLGVALAAARIIVLPPPAEDGDDQVSVSALAAGAAAGLLGLVAREQLGQAIMEELADYPPAVRQANLERALAAFDAMAEHAGCVAERTDDTASARPVDWVDLPHDAADIASASIDAGATSVLVRTGLWRTMRPVIDLERCRKCTWVCGSYCPDGVIAVNGEGFPEIDYEHCKGCMICVAQCPTHAISAIAEDTLAPEQRSKRGAAA